MTTTRRYAASARLKYAGIYIIGGDAVGTTSDYLAPDSMQWQEGPSLPQSMTHPCVVPITATSFLAIHKNDIHEFDAAIAGPTSSEGWREGSRWPRLRTFRKWNPSCVKS